MTGNGGRRPSAGRSQASQIARLVAEDFFRGTLDLASRNMPAEAGAVNPRPPSGAGHDSRADSPSLHSVRTAQRIRSLGGNDRVVRLFLTFICAMNRARDAAQLWGAGMRLYEEDPTIFDPRHVAGLEFDRLRDVLKSNLVSRRHRPETRAWLQIATSLSAVPESPVRRLIEAGYGDARELLCDLKTRDETHRSRFPMLRGPKVGPMWIRMMAYPGRAAIDQIKTIPVAVDVQVRRATENLGVTETRGWKGLRKAKPVIQQAWMEAVSNADIGGPPGITGTCSALDPALWFFGRHGCGHCKKAGRRVRFGRACDHCTADFSGRSNLRGGSR